MAPKVKSNKANTAATPTATTNKETPKKSKSNINLAKDAPLRGKAARNEFLTDVAAASGVSLGDVKKTIDGLRTVLGRNLKENGRSHVPTIMTLRIKTTPAREEGTAIIYGVEKKVKARGETKRITIASLKELKGLAL